MTPARVRRNSGFTLIELVVVLLILAVLAGLVVPLVGWIRRSANYASGANNQSTLMANLELYRTTFGNANYPDRMDSLLTSAVAPALPVVPSYFSADLAGMITPGPFATADEFASINNSGRGLKTVMDHEDPISAAIEGNPGNTGILPRDIAFSPTPHNMAFLNTTTATGASLTNVNQLLTALGYVSGTTPTLPTDIRLVLVGVGPSNTAIGRTMQSVPFDTNVDTSETYNRFIAVYTVYSPREGRRSQLKAILCPRGRVVNRNLSEFHQSVNPE
jgi:prepilin-type N-terminal cleavage/methylation domain-containing protein